MLVRTGPLCRTLPAWDSGSPVGPCGSFYFEQKLQVGNSQPEDNLTAFPMVWNPRANRHDDGQRRKWAWPSRCERRRGSLKHRQICPVAIASLPRHLAGRCSSQARAPSAPKKGLGSPLWPALPRRATQRGRSRTLAPSEHPTSKPSSAKRLIRSMSSWLEIGVHLQGRHALLLGVAEVVSPLAPSTFLPVTLTVAQPSLAAFFFVEAGATQPLTV